MKLEGKHVLITGGSSGIGLATAQALLDKGARVFITGRRRDALATAIDQLLAGGGHVDGVAADVATDEGRRAKMIALNREDRAAIDQRFSALKPALAAAVRDHSAL